MRRSETWLARGRARSSFQAIPVLVFKVHKAGLPLSIFIVVNLGVSSKGAAVNWLTSLFFIVSALINVGLNIMLIPAHGTMGARDA